MIAGVGHPERLFVVDVDAGRSADAFALDETVREGLDELETGRTGLPVGGPLCDTIVGGGLTYVDETVGVDGDIGGKL